MERDFDGLAHWRRLAIRTRRWPESPRANGLDSFFVEPESQALYHFNVRGFAVRQ